MNEFKYEWKPESVLNAHLEQGWERVSNVKPINAFGDKVYFIRIRENDLKERIEVSKQEGEIEDERI